MISNIKWNLGRSDDSNVTTSIFYTRERETTVYSGRSTTWAGYVGLMYPSDYGYAVGGELRNTCLTTQLGSYNENNCFKNDWLYLNNHQWTLSWRGSQDAFAVSLFGVLSYNYTYGIHAVSPVVYLNTNIELISGRGTSSDPYTIKLP